MPTSIDELQIEINAKAVKANDAIDRLVGKLNGLTTSLGNLNPSNLNGLANGVQKLGIAMQTMKDVKKTDFNKVARGISAFEKIDSAKLSSLSTTLSPLATSIGTLGAVKFDNKNIQTLINSLTRLSNANLNSLANVNFTQFGNSINQLSASLSNTPKIQQSVISMTNAIANLSKSGANIPVVASSLQTLGGSLNRFMSIMANAPSVTDSTVAFTQAISSLANAGTKAGVTAGNLSVLGVELKNLMSTLSTAPMISQSIIDMTNALANLSTQGSKVGSASRSIQRSLNGTYSSTVKASKGFNGLASAIGKFYASYFMVIRGVKGIWSSIESTADYIEAYNYFNVALGKIGSDWSHQFEQYGYENAEAYAESFNKRLSEGLKDLSGVQVTIGTDGKGLLTETGMKNLGLNIQEVTQYASQLASVTNSVGQTGEVSLATANAFTKLGADMSSLFNVDYSSVMNNLQSGLIGQSRALYKYGIDITNATLQTKAYQLGLTKAVSEMSQMEKQQLRVISILEQSKVSWGDLANTINSPSNLMRIFKNNLKETGMMLGQLFIPMLSKVVPILNGVTIAFKRLLVNIASFMGVELDLDAFGQGYNDLEDDTGSLGDTYDDLAESIKEAKSQLLGFDEVNKLQDTSATATVDAEMGGIDLTDEILKATDEYQKIWQEAFDKMEANSNKWADAIEKALSGIGDVFEDFALGEYFKAGEDVSQLVIDLNNFITKAIKNVDWQGIGKNVGLFLKGIKWTEIIISLSDVIYSAFDGLWDAWIAMMKESPIETALLTAIALTRIDVVRDALTSKLDGVGGTAMSPLKIKTYLAITVIGIQVSKKLGEMIGEAITGDFDPWVYIDADNEQAQKIQEIADKYENLNSKVEKYIELSKDYDNLSDEEKGYVYQMGKELEDAGIVTGINDITKAWEGTNTELVKAIQNQKLLAQISSSQKRVDELRGQLEEAESERTRLHAEYADLGISGLLLTPWKEVELSNALKDNEKEIDALKNSLTGAEQVVIKLENDFNELNGITKPTGRTSFTGEGAITANISTDEALKKLDEYFEALSKKGSTKPTGKTSFTGDGSIIISPKGSSKPTGKTSFMGDSAITANISTDEALEKLDELIFGYENVEKKINKNSIKPVINNNRYVNGLNNIQTLFKGMVYDVNNANISPKMNNTSIFDSITNIARKYNENKNTIELSRINPALTGTSIFNTIASIKNTYDSNKKNIENSKIKPSINSSTAISQSNSLASTIKNTFSKFTATVSVKSDNSSMSSLKSKIGEMFSKMQIELSAETVGGKVLATFKKIAGFKTGGFPEDGLFFANHNELVGQFSNGKTAVANNEQITQGIAQAVAPAVYSAVVSAMQNTQRGNSDVVVNIDGKQVFKAVQRQANDYTAQTGLSPFNI